MERRGTSAFKIANADLDASHDGFRTARGRPVIPAVHKNSPSETNPTATFLSSSPLVNAVRTSATMSKPFEKGSHGPPRRPSFNRFLRWHHVRKRPKTRRENARNEMKTPQLSWSLSFCDIAFAQLFTKGFGELLGSLHSLFVYRTENGVRFYVITESDRRVTNVELHISDQILSLRNVELPFRCSHSSRFARLQLNIIDTSRDPAPWPIHRDKE